jgi:hypothetical protein
MTPVYSNRRAHANGCEFMRHFLYVFRVAGFEHRSHTPRFAPYPHTGAGVAVKEAQEFLKGLVNNKVIALPPQEIFKLANAEGFTKAAVKRAKENLRLVSRKKASRTPSLAGKRIRCDQRGTTRCHDPRRRSRPLAGKRKVARRSL